MINGFYGGAGDCEKGNCEGGDFRNRESIRGGASEGDNFHGGCGGGSET